MAVCYGICAGSLRNGRRFPDSGESGYGIEDVEDVEGGKDVTRFLYGCFARLIAAGGVASLMGRTGPYGR